MRMEIKDVEKNARELAHTVIMSFQDEKKAQSWLKHNKNYKCKTDRVINKAIVIIRTTLQDQQFSLSKYKQTNA